MKEDYISCIARFELTDPRAQNIVKLITESIQVDKLRFLFAMPFLRHIFPEMTGWNKQKEVRICAECMYVFISLCLN